MNNLSAGRDIVRGDAST